MANLTEKQAIFCKEYIKDFNATRSTIAAGYSVNDLLKNNKHYTYGLISRVDSSCFYIGKGSGIRVYTHQRDARKGKITPKKKKIIESIDSEGGIDFIIFDYFDVEKDAYLNEDLMIKKLGFDNLTNLKDFDGRVSIAEKESHDLPSVYDFKTSKDWALACLEKIKSEGRSTRKGQSKYCDIVLNILDDCISSPMVIKNG